MEATLPTPLQSMQSAAQPGSNVCAISSSTAGAQVLPTSNMSTVVDCEKSTTITKGKRLSKEIPSNDPRDQHSSSSTISVSRPSTRRRGIRLLGSSRKPRNRPRYLEAFAFPLGMSIAAIVAQVLDQKDAVDNEVLVDHLSQICASAVRESLVNFFGDKFDSFVENFEKSFRSTLMTLQLINKSTKISGGGNRELARGEQSAERASASSLNRLDNSVNDFCKLAKGEHYAAGASASSLNRLDYSSNDFNKLSAEGALVSSLNRLDISSSDFCKFARGVHSAEGASASSMNRLDSSVDFRKLAREGHSAEGASASSLNRLDHCSNDFYKLSAEGALASSLNRLDISSNGFCKLSRGVHSAEGASASSLNRYDISANDFCTEERVSETISQAASSGEQITNHEDIQDSMGISSGNQQLILHNREVMQQLAFLSPSQSLDVFKPSDNQTILSTLERSVVQQARSNDLKTFEMGLTMKKIQLKERELALSTDSNFLEWCKLSLGLNKMSFKIEKFKTQVEDTRHAELLKRCTDYLFSGIFIMLLCLAYGVFVFSHQRITEATAACSSSAESKSWWMPKQISFINSGWQMLKCQSLALVRMLAGGFMVIAIVYLLFQRSAISNQTMPVTIYILLLGVVCGISGKLSVDTLGGDGHCWLYLWWIFCLIHIFSNVSISILYTILYGPITMPQNRKRPFVPYSVRRFLFYTACLLLPFLCGLLPFASLSEWKDHASSCFMHHLLPTEDPFQY